MLRSSETETEILLGSKQLVGIFFVVAILLGAAFTGGYMVGKGPAAKKAVAANATAEPPAPASTAPAIGETHSVPAESDTTPRATQNEEPPLGSPERKTFEKARTAQTIPPPSGPSETFVPQAGESFLQVAAVGRDEAEAIADVLRRKHFRAHAVPKPGNPKLYRVLIGPVADAADLSTTRDALRKTGFGEVILQKY